MWSIWLCGRPAGQVRPRTVRCQPGRNAARPGPRSCSRPRRSPGRPGAGAARASRRSWIGGPYGSRDERCTPTRSTLVPPTSSTTCSAAAFGRRVAEHGPHREASQRLGRDAAEHREAHVPEPAAVARHVRPGIEPGPTEPELEHLGTEPSPTVATAATPPSGVHDSCRTTTSASMPAQDRVEVVGLADAVAAGLQPGVALKLAMVSSGIEAPYGVRRAGSAHVAGGRRRSGRPRSSTVPPCCSVIALTIERPSPRPPASRARPSSSRVNRSNTRSRSSAGMPGPVVVDGELDGVVVVGCSSTADRARAWRAALSRRLRTTRASCSRRPCTRPADTRVVSTGTRAAARSRRAPARRGRSRGAMSTGAAPSASSRRASVEQLAHRVLHALVLGQRTLGDRGPVGAVGVAQRDLEVGADRRERAAQLVRRVGHELPLALRRRLEPVEHRVHRAGQAPDLVVGVGLGHPPVDGGAGDLLGLAPDRLDRPQRATGEVPGRERDEQRSARAPTTSSTSVTLSTVESTSASDCCATSVMLPAGGLDLALRRRRSRRSIGRIVESGRSARRAPAARRRWRRSRRVAGAPRRTARCSSSSWCWLVSWMRSTRLVCTTRTSPNAAALNAIANTSVATSVRRTRTDCGHHRHGVSASRRQPSGTSR